MEYTVENCLKMLPSRYHDEFVNDVIVDEHSISNLRKVFTYYIEEIWSELTDEEKVPFEETFLFIEL